MSCVLAGGGLNDCRTYGETDELSKSMVRDSVSVPDFLPPFVSHCKSTLVSIFMIEIIQYPMLVMGNLLSYLSSKDPKDDLFEFMIYLLIIMLK